MITDPTQSPFSSPSKDEPLNKRNKKRRSLQYVSRHFSPQRAVMKGADDQKKTKKRKIDRELKQTKNGGSAEGQSHATPVATLGVACVIKARSRRGKSTGKKRRSEQTNTSVIVSRVKIASDETTKGGLTADADAPALVPWQQVLAAPASQRQETFQRLLCGVNLDELSSDSELTDVPDEIGPDPFEAKHEDAVTQPISTLNQEGAKPEAAGFVAAKTGTRKVPPKRKSKTKSTPAKSPYFPHANKLRPTFLSTLPFPPLHIDRFGLMQERLHQDPFRLLLATIFLNKTPGHRAMPIFFKLMEQYPTPEDLAKAEQGDVTAIIYELGFQNQRARKCIAMAKRWVEDPPVKGRRWRKVGYPRKGDGKDVKANEIIDDEDSRVAWEISHLPGLGPYSHDSWRMFCRDELRGLSSAYNGEDAKMAGDMQFEPEWKRVLPTDKELRAWMTWMWMKEGWIWNKETGERTKASDELMELARGQDNIVLESEDNTLLVKSLHEDALKTMKLDKGIKSDVKVEAPAGDFIPGFGEGNACN